MILRHKNKKINIPARKVGFFGKIFGLMFRTKQTKNLLFSFKKKTKMPIHSFFVFFKFLALWADDKNNILEMQIVKPFRFHVKPKNEFSNLIEIPINYKNRGILKILVGQKV